MTESVLKCYDRIKQMLQRKSLNKWTGTLTIILPFRDGGIGLPKIVTEETLKEE